MSRITLSEWIYMIADQQPAVDRNIYYDRAEDAVVLESMADELDDLEATWMFRITNGMAGLVARARNSLLSMKRSTPQ